MGGMATTVCYHRSIAHRALRLNPLCSAKTFVLAVNPV